MTVARRKRTLDRLFSKYILNSRGRVCVRCGSRNRRMNVCHIIPRQCLKLRWSEDNVFVACVGCHKFGTHSWHQDPLNSVIWLLKEKGRPFCDSLVSQSVQPYVFNEQEFQRLERSLTQPASSSLTTPLNAAWCFGC